MSVSEALTGGFLGSPGGATWCQESVRSPGSGSTAATSPWFPGSSRPGGVDCTAAASHLEHRKDLLKIVVVTMTHRLPARRAAEAPGRPQPPRSPAPTCWEWHRPPSKHRAVPAAQISHLGGGGGRATLQGVPPGNKYFIREQTSAVKIKELRILREKKELFDSAGQLVCFRRGRAPGCGGSCLAC